MRTRASAAAVAAVTAAAVPGRRPTRTRGAALGQVLLAPNFSATVARPAYADPAHPGCRFVDLAESANVGPFVY